MLHLYMMHLGLVALLMDWVSKIIMQIMIIEFSSFYFKLIYLLRPQKKEMMQSTNSDAGSSTKASDK